MPWASASISPESIAGRRVWMVGAAGTGMSGLARLLAAAGAVVRGEDADGGEALDRLVQEGFAMQLGTAPALPEDTDLVVATAAIPAAHPTLVRARARGLPIRTYAQTLGQLHLERTGVSVAGTHGKSTTTCLLTWCLLRAGLDPGFIAGATCGVLGGNARPGSGRTPAGPFAGRGGLLVTESCEFDRSFHNLRPATAIVNNVEAEHLDCYADLDEVIESFTHFAGSLPPASDGGFLLIAHEGANRERVCARTRAAVETFGPHAEATHRVERAADGGVRVISRGRESLRWHPSLIGAHNALNAAAAGVMALRLGADRAAVEAALSDFPGLDRRQQAIGRIPAAPSDVRVFDDYGHHPTEIRVTLRAFREAFPGQRLICVFQPHQHSRTRHLLEDFGRAFSDADRVILPPIHFVRDPESERALVNSEMVADRVRAAGGDAVAVSDLAAATASVRACVRAGDIVVTMGAGAVWKVARTLVGGAADAP
jgi:UDP-N-acetylmuramate--alanine ligase